MPGGSGSDGRDRGAVVDLSVDLAPGRGGFVLANPILVASGTFGYGIEYGDVVDVQRLGAVCCKGTTLKPRVGNVPPRVTETPGGMLNSIGLQNPGVDAVIEKYAPIWQRWQTPVIVNVAGESIADYAEVTRRLDGVPGVAAIELNISCPNVGKGGLQFAIDAEAAGAVTAAVRRVTDLPLLVKLSPNVADIRPIARAIEDAGADALTAINTLAGMAGRHTGRRHRRRHRAGGRAGLPGGWCGGGPGGHGRLRGSDAASAARRRAGGRGHRGRSRLVRIIHRHCAPAPARRAIRQGCRVPTVARRASPSRSRSQIEPSARSATCNR